MMTNSTTAVALPPVSFAGMTATQARQVQTTLSMRGADAGAHRYVAPGTPPSTPTMRQLLVDGSYGPVTSAGATPSIQIPDGPGFGGVMGHQQDAADRARNSYSVLDPNFFAALGVLRDTSTGTARSFTSQVQAYDAAGYVAVFHPDLYQRMVTAQDAGKGTVLGMSLALLGIPGAPADPGLAAAGLAAGMLIGELVPGSPLLARDAVLGATDMTGAQWSQPSHAESGWRIYARLVESGIDWREAGALSGDIAVSTAGRLNGWSAQAETSTGLTDAEAAMVIRASQLEERTGVPALFIVGGAHNHAGLDPNVRSLPRINQLLGLAAADRSASAERLTAIRSIVHGGAGAPATTVAGGPAAPASTAGVTANASLVDVLTKLGAVLAMLTTLIEQLTHTSLVGAGGAPQPTGGCTSSGGTAPTLQPPVQVERSTSPPATVTKAS